MTFCVMTPSILGLIVTLGIMTFCTMPPSIMGFIVTLSITSSDNDTQHNGLILTLSINYYQYNNIAFNVVMSVVSEPLLKGNAQYS